MPGVRLRDRASRSRAQSLKGSQYTCSYFFLRLIHHFNLDTQRRETHYNVGASDIAVIHKIELAKKA